MSETSSPAVEVCRVPVRDLGPADIAHWRQLARRSTDPNPFVHPAFAIPLDRHAAENPLQLEFVRNRESGAWLAAGLFRDAWPCRTYPLPHLSAEASNYSFLDQPLLDRDQGRMALDVWLQDLSARRSCLGLRFRAVRRDSSVMRLLDATAERQGLVRRSEACWGRAQLCLQDVDQESLLLRCTKSRRKSLRRARRWLEDRGRVSFRLLFPEEGDTAAAERFLQLEGMGWKGVDGTALGACERRAAFFREVVSGFAREQGVCFGELMLEDQVVASSVNLACANALFAFKIGWRPCCGRGSPGLWSEIELASRLAAMQTGLTHIDSCSPAGSHLESVWPDRCTMEAVTYTWSRRGNALAGWWTRLKQLRGAIGSTLEKNTAQLAARSGV